MAQKKETWRNAQKKILSMLKKYDQKYDQNMIKNMIKSIKKPHVDQRNKAIICVLKEELFIGNTHTHTHTQICKKLK